MQLLSKRQRLARRRLAIAGTVGLGTFICIGLAIFDSEQPAAKPSPEANDLVLELPEQPQAVESRASLAEQTGDGKWAPVVSGERRQAKPRASKDQVAAPWTVATVAPGDNMSLIFSRLKLSKTDLHYIVENNEHAKYLKRVKPGQTMRFRTEGGKVLALALEIDPLTTLRVERDANGFSSFLDIIQPEIRVAHASAEIQTSLFIDGQKAGLSDAVIMHLTDIFGWDIDFALDIREHDRFSVIYEEVFKEGELIKQNRILAAEFINRGKRLKAVLFTDDDGDSAYYSESGEAMKKAFLRTPVNFTRISSRFNLRRKHPILNTIRAHRGVDYAAPMGTPVRATANGKILSAGTNGGYGRTVEIQHGETYRTLYAHLSRIARGIKRRASVKQGQIVGYIGKSGLATGPHLHYEFRVNGVHRNPLTVALPKAEPIAQQYFARFQAHAAPYLQQLAHLSESELPLKNRYLAGLDLPMNDHVGSGHDKP